MLRYNTFRSARFLRSRFQDGRYALASEVSDTELELIDYHRQALKATIGDGAVGMGWKPELYQLTAKVTNVDTMANELTLLLADNTILDVLLNGDRVFEGDVLRATVTSADSLAGTVTVTSTTGITAGDTIRIMTSNCVLIRSGEAWVDGLPFIMRDGRDPLVTGSTLAPTFTPPANVIIRDEPNGEGKVIRLGAGGTTTSNTYSIVIQATEQVITDSEDPFLKNINVPESTAQKMRMRYNICVVEKSKLNNSPIPYNNSNNASSFLGNLVNYIEITVQPGSNGSVISMTPSTGTQGIDGGDLEVLIRNNIASGSPVGNPIPISPTECSEFTNGKLIDSLGQEYHIVQITSTTTEATIKLDLQVGQPNPVLSTIAPYKLVKRDVYVTSDSGSPQGYKHFLVGEIDWNSSDGLVHLSSVTDLRDFIEEQQLFQLVTTTKFNMSLMGGGIITAEPKTPASTELEVTNNSSLTGLVVEINGASLAQGTDWAIGASANDSASNIASAINSSTDPLLENIVSAVAVGPVVTVTAVVAGAAGNSITTSVSGNTGAAFDDTTLYGGRDGTPGELVWTSGFTLVNPNGPNQSIGVGRAVLKEGGSLAYKMDLVSGGTISKGEISTTMVSTSSGGTVLNLDTAEDLALVMVGNTVLVEDSVTGDYESATITEIDAENFVLTVSSAISFASGTAYIFLDTYGYGSLPYSQEYFVLAVKSGSQIKVTGKSELDSGESTSSGIPIQLLNYIGSTSESDDYPNYSSNNYVADGDSLTVAIGKLDTALDATDAVVSGLVTDVMGLEDREIQNNNAKLIKGGVWHWDGTDLSWSLPAYIQIPDLADTDNTLNADSVTVPSDGQVVSVELNRTAGGPALSASVDAIGSITASANTLIIARRVGNDILIGKSFLLKEGQRLELDGALPEISRRLDQLKITNHESTLSKVRISSADLLQLNGSVLSQELNNILLKFDGAVIDFDSGDILESDDSTPLSSFTPSTVPVSEYFWYGISLNSDSVDSDNRLIPQFIISPAAGSDSVDVDAPFPNITGSKKLGAVQVYNNAGNIEVYAIRTLGAGSGSGGGAGSVYADLYDPINTSLPTGTWAIIDGQLVQNGDKVLFSNLGTGNNRIYEVSGVGVSLVWTPSADFSGNSTDPSLSELVVIREGTSFGLQVGKFDGSGFIFNDNVRFFSGVDYYEQSGLKTASILNNTSGTVLSINPANSENIQMNFSIKRGTTKEVDVAQIAFLSEQEPQIEISGVGLGTTGVDLSIDYGNFVADTGALDSEFFTNVGTGFNSTVYGFAVQPDDKIIVAGTFTQYDGVGVSNLVRLNSDGTADTTFNSNISGLGTLSKSPVIQSDGKILVTADTGTRLFRFNPDGTSDTTFNLALGAGFDGNIEVIRLEADGSILVGGSFTDFDGTSVGRLARLSSSGVLDTTFNTNIGSGAASTVRDITVQTDGKILLVGSFVSFNSTLIGRLIRLNSNGTEDTSFTTNIGTAITSGAGFKVVVQADGKIVIIGTFTSFNGNTRNRIVRLESSGIEDSAFYTNIGTGFNAQTSAILIQDDGKLLIGGFFSSFNSNTRNMLVRLNSDGTEDSNFYSDLGSGFDPEIFALDTLLSGKIIVGGDFTSFDSTSISKIAALDYSYSLRVLYTADNSGSDGTLKYWLTRWSDNPGGPAGVPSYTGTTSSIAAAGSDTEIQFNSSGALGSSSDLRFSTGSLYIGDYEITKQSQVTLLDNQTGAVATTWLDSVPSIFVDYEVVRDGEVRVGLITIANNGVSPQILDTGADTGSGVTFSVDVSGGDLRLLYDTTNTGQAGTMRFSTRRII